MRLARSVSRLPTSRRLTMHERYRATRSLYNGILDGPQVRFGERRHHRVRMPAVHSDVGASDRAVLRPTCLTRSGLTTRL